MDLSVTDRDREQSTSVNNTTVRSIRSANVLGGAEKLPRFLRVLSALSRRNVGVTMKLDPHVTSVQH